jgi:hypothetical protein
LRRPWPVRRVERGIVNGGYKVREFFFFHSGRGPLTEGNLRMSREQRGQFRLTMGAGLLED